MRPTRISTTEASTSKGDTKPDTGSFAPFRHRGFVLIWSASFVANFGTVIHTMAAAWVMAHLVSSPAMVALVQTATSLPTMLLALFTGVTADRFGRRRQMLVAQSLALLSGTALTCAAFEGVLTPWSLLLFAFLLGLAQAVYLPAWQSSIGEQVPRPVVPAAVAFNAIGLNIARCIGPMIGGIVLILLGPVAAFGFNTLGFACVVAALLMWSAPRPTDATEGKSLLASLREGLAFGLSRPSLRATYVRCAIFALFAACPYAFLPLIARDLVGGGVGHYTVVQSMFGAGAVAAGLGLARLRRVASLHGLAVAGSCLIGAAMVLVGLNASPVLTMLLLFPIGGAWVTGFSIFNIATQIEAPPALIGRLLAIYQVTISLGLAVGSAIWGGVSRYIGVSRTLVVAGFLVLILQWFLSRRFRMATLIVR